MVMTGGWCKRHCFTYILYRFGWFFSPFSFSTCPEMGWSQGIRLQGLQARMASQRHWNDGCEWGNYPGKKKNKENFTPGFQDR
jgi:hypothetical protein